jgi:hypothetical protein
MYILDKSHKNPKMHQTYSPFLTSTLIAVGLPAVRGSAFPFWAQLYEAARVTKVDLLENAVVAEIQRILKRPLDRKSVHMALHALPACQKPNEMVVNALSDAALNTAEGYEIDSEFVKDLQENFPDSYDAIQTATETRQVELALRLQEVADAEN